MVGKRINKEYDGRSLFTAPSSNGQDTAFSRLESGFDSPWGHQPKSTRFILVLFVSRGYGESNVGARRASRRVRETVASPRPTGRPRGEADSPWGHQSRFFVLIFLIPLVDKG